MSLDDMAEELRVSKGSGSTNIRELENWGAVSRIWVKGDRKDYYEAEVDYTKILLDSILPFIRRKLDSSAVETWGTRNLLQKPLGFLGGRQRLGRFLFWKAQAD